MSHARLGKILQSLAAESDRTAGDASASRQQTHAGQRRHRLAAARFAHQRQRLPGRHLEADTVHRAHGLAVGAELHLQLLDLQQRRTLLFQSVHRNENGPPGRSAQVSDSGSEAGIETRFRTEIHQWW